MFRCSTCHEVTAPTLQPTLVVAGKRRVEYNTTITDTRGKVLQTSKSRGWEIVKENQLCPKCFLTHDPEAPVREEPGIQTVISAHIVRPLKKKAFGRED